MTVVADTTFLVDGRRRKPGAARLAERFHKERTRILIPTICLAEFLAGSAYVDGDLELANRAGQVVNFTADDARSAARLARLMMGRGEFPGWSDVMIAGVAENRGGLPVVTRDPKHFPESKTMTY